MTGDEHINDLASQLGRHLTVFQMEVNHEIPALVLAAQVGIIARVATHLEAALRANPTARVEINPRLNEGLEKAFLDALGISTDVPDHPPEG